MSVHLRWITAMPMLNAEIQWGTLSVNAIQASQEMELTVKVNLHAYHLFVNVSTYLKMSEPIIILHSEIQISQYSSAHISPNH